MADNGKFEAFKRDLVEKNERTYGAEVRDRWGNAAADAANARVMGLSLGGVRARPAARW